MLIATAVFRPTNSPRNGRCLAATCGLLHSLGLADSYSSPTAIVSSLRVLKLPESRPRSSVLFLPVVSSHLLLNINIIITEGHHVAL